MQYILDFIQSNIFNNITQPLMVYTCLIKKKVQVIVGPWVISILGNIFLPVFNKKVSIEFSRRHIFRKIGAFVWNISVHYVTVSTLGTI